MKKQPAKLYKLVYTVCEHQQRYDFETLEEAAMCFYGKVEEIKTRYKDLRKAPRIVMSLFMDKKIIINYCLEDGQYDIIDLRPNEDNLLLEL